METKIKIKIKYKNRSWLLEPFSMSKFNLKLDANRCQQSDSLCLCKWKQIRTAR